MRIRKLGLYGFKSFPDRTVLTFDPGISCVVGPNGCGKSNIVDALKWCMGEQSARALRGSEMQDVIFAGSADRKPVGFAEVLITFTASGGEPFPGEYARFEELEVGRRLHRNGSSEYLINGAKSRRRDIVELFLDTGVGNNLYSFIEQGSIGKIVHASPLERRSLVDEAAGISKYKSRREEARSRLAATAQQLDRAADVEQELNRRVRSLERQVVKAAQFRGTRARVRQLEILLALAKYADLSVDRRKLRNDRRLARDGLAKLERELARRELEVAARREELDVVEAAIGTWRDDVAELDARQRELTGASSFRRKRIEELQAEGERVALVIEEGSRELTSLDERQAALTEEQRVTEQRLSEARVREGEAVDAELLAVTGAEEAATLREDLRRQRADAERREAGLEARLSGAAEALAAGPGKLGALEHAIERLVVEVAEAGKAVDDGASEVAERVATNREASAAHALADGQLRLVEEQRAAAEKRLAEARAALAAGHQAVEVARSEQARSADQARGRVIAAVRSAERVGRQAIEQLERQRAATQRDGQRRLRDSDKALRQRAESWRSGVRKFQTSATSAAVAAVTRQVDQARQERLQAHRAALQALAARLSEKERQLVGERDEALAALRSAVDAARAASKARSQEAVAARESWRRAEDEERAAKSEREGIRAQRRALLAATAGASAVHAACPDAQPLGDLLGSAVLERHGAALRERVMLPVLRTEEALRLAAHAAADAGPAEAMYLPGTDTGEALAMRILAGVESVDDIAAAVSRASRGGARLVVAGSGERFDADGHVHLGSSGSSRQAANLSRALAAAEATVAETSTALVAAQQALSSSEAEAAAAAALLEATEAEAAASEDALRAAADQAREQARAEADEARAELDKADVAARDAEAERLSAAQATAEATYGDHGAGDDAWLDEALELLAASAEEALQGELVALQAKLDMQQEANLASTEEAEQKALAAEQALAAERQASVDDLIARIETLSQSVADRAVVVDQARQVESERRAEAQDARAQALTAREQLRAAELAQGHRTERHTGLQDSLKRARTEHQALTATLADVRAEHERLAAALQELRLVLTALVATLGEHDIAGAATDAELQVRRAVLADQRVEIARLETLASSVAESLERGSETREQAVARVEGAREHHRSLEQQSLDLAGELTAGDVELEQITKQRAEAWDRLERERARTTALRIAWTEAEAAHRALGQQRDGEVVRVAELEADVQRVRLEVEALKNRIDERYQVSLPGLLDHMEARGGVTLESDPLVRDDREFGGNKVAGVPDLRIRPGMLSDFDGIAEGVKEMESLRRELARIGEVNLAAIEEYEDVAKRHGDLVEQRADLDASIQRIRSAIAKMNKMCRQRFRDAFDRVNERFQELYPQLVGGGSARLSLTDEDDLLETGVDIFVQPPGKRLQNLGLLSGGEKAMTAIAMLLSLFHVKPSPYCVLDEVDAPLDEANGNRFNDILREMSHATQFILVTHNRKTMECGDTLYGITMPTPGVSRLVSVRLDAEAGGA